MVVRLGFATLILSSSCSITAIRFVLHSVNSHSRLRQKLEAASHFLIQTDMQLHGERTPPRTTHTEALIGRVVAEGGGNPVG